jgi:DNA ligase D-like protein (predicted 3'-phosphoesterase)
VAISSTVLTGLLTLYDQRRKLVQQRTRSRDEGCPATYHLISSIWRRCLDLLRTGIHAGTAEGYCRLVSATRFVVQLHDATTLHFDLRIQAGEVLRSWAVPKGPSLDPGVRRLAVPVEDHELPAGQFEGVHEGQLRGSGAVIIWDEGPAEVSREDPGHLAVTLHGSKLAGGFALTRTGERRWILVKTSDGAARPGSDIVAERPASVRTGRTWEEVAAGRAGPPRPRSSSRPADHDWNRS